jgi:hypothetical protein
MIDIGTLFAGKFIVGLNLFIKVYMTNFRGSCRETLDNNCHCSYLSHDCSISLLVFEKIMIQCRLCTNYTVVKTSVSDFS